MNLKPVEGVKRVAIRRGKIIFAIESPEVFKYLALINT